MPIRTAMPAGPALPAIPDSPFGRTSLGRTGLKVTRLGLSGSFGLDAATVEEAIEHGMNYVLWYGRLGEVTVAVKNVIRRRREAVVVASGANFGLPFLVRRAANSIRKTLGIDVIDVFHLFWVRGEYAIGPRVLDVLDELKHKGMIRFSAVSTHDRARAARIARDGRIDVLMIRYNAAHRGAEGEIFPELAAHDPGVVAYTATRWGRLLEAPRGYTGAIRPPAAPECYRFALSNPAVDVVLTGPKNRQELAENLAGLAEGPLSAARHAELCEFGDVVRAKGGALGAIYERRGILTA